MRRSPLLASLVLLVAAACGGGGGTETGVSNGAIVSPEREAAVAERAQRRAYSGAPPTIPHEVDDQDVSSCLGCHKDGMDMGDQVAPPIPHAAYTSCTQCHAASQPKVPPGAGLAGGPGAVENGFSGLESPRAGGRASAEAPPVIPHRTWLRENCLSCHGPLGKPGLRTPHPERSSCTQCHAPAASLDQR